MILGGDQSWTRRVIGVSACPQVGSMFNEGIWNAQKKGGGGISHAPGKAMRLVIRPSSLGRLPCKPPVAVCNQSCVWPVRALSCAFCT